ncbi:MAG: 50S ribosomal protein L7Ae-like protein [Epulopiscium sp.]|mgnify:FL=1|nr:50S ribosomal protein L7Ae-like protein [Candidatus Epulonipiscium sp.]
MKRLKTRHIVVGAKQVNKLLERKQAEIVYVAHNAEDRVVRRILEMAKEQGIELVMVENMRQLGEACNVEVETATAAVIK